jgi:hypothetical protein
VQAGKSVQEESSSLKTSAAAAAGKGKKRKTSVSAGTEALIECLRGMGVQLTAKPRADSVTSKAAANKAAKVYQYPSRKHFSFSNENLFNSSRDQNFSLFLSL